MRRRGIVHDGGLWYSSFKRSNLQFQKRIIVPYHVYDQSPYRNHSVHVLYEEGYFSLPIRSRKYLRAFQET